ncbi:MAG: 5-carboxymethyl-2-hydroxymuconate Delta-isomerase [Granulosicoccus sp.]|nr:5-carboxymethyl-2-hydroxymuconate Delta-isomerase [Granulosicoccus sp.]
MPHFIVEYSTNIESQVDMAELANRIRDDAVATGVFPLGGIRVRMHPCSVYTIADGNPDAAFIHIQLRLGAGRDLQVRKTAGDSLFDSLVLFLESVFESIPFALSFEMVEIDSVLTYKKNNIRNYLS